MELTRSSGLLLHITSLPGNEGCGTLGQEAYDFADFLHKSRIMYWQLLPICPVEKEMAYSPYASSSAFAGNPLLISIESLKKEAWFSPKIRLEPIENTGQANFDEAIKQKELLLYEAFTSFFVLAEKTLIDDFDSFCAKNAFWLDDYALFSVISKRLETKFWPSWDNSYQKASLYTDNTLRKSSEVRFYKFIQYIFFTQWKNFKEYCESLNIRLIGDIPIYISLDSADAWANPHILELDDSFNPIEVAGVPPDYFSETGQRWGNPLYQWFTDSKNLNTATVEWWKNRLHHIVELFDLVRLDHFIGFESYWAIPAEEKTAINGKWRKGPGILLFESIDMDDFPFIAEDLGLITPEVEKLRGDLGLPGMKILQFAFDGDHENTHLPHNYENPNTVLYTGTHDNNTINGWFYGDETSTKTRQYVMEYMGAENFSDMHNTMLRSAYASIARLIITPMQDFLGFGEEHRMNTPGTIEKNWLWRFKDADITDELAEKIRRLGQLYNRIGINKEQD